MGARGEGLINDFGGSLSDNRMIVHGSESLRRAGRRRVPQREEESKYYLVDADEGDYRPGDHTTASFGTSTSAAFAN